MIWQPTGDFLLLLVDVALAGSIGILLLGRVKEPRTLWLLRGYLFLVGLAWMVQRYAPLPLTSKLIDALVLACSLALAILWQGDLRRLMELLGTGRIGVLFADRSGDQLTSGSVSTLTEAAGRLSQARRGALMVLDVGSGGALPGAVLAICAPGVQVHCVDAVAKKAAFIRQLRAELGLGNLHAHHARLTPEGERGQPAIVVPPVRRMKSGDCVSIFTTSDCLIVIGPA